MSRVRRALRPALPASAAFVAGVALPAAACATFCIGWVAYCVCSKQRTAVWLLLACLLGGVAHEWRDDRMRRERLDALFARTNLPVQAHFVGRVARAPSVDAAGEASFVLRTAKFTLGLRVRELPGDDRSRFDRLERGTAVRVWATVRPALAAGNPTALDPDRIVRARGLDAYGSIKSSRLIERIAAADHEPWPALDRLRGRLRERLARAFGEQAEVEALLAALLLGERSQLSPDLMRRVRDAGLAHLLAISGLHVGLCAGLGLGLLRRGRIGGWPLALLGSLLLLCFALVVGGRPSVWRAAIACAVLLLGRTIGREGDGLNSLALIATALLIVAPALIADAGFQLSFVAVAAILLDLSSRAAPGVPLTAYLATAPLAALHFGRLAPIALLTNVAAIPCLAVALAAGYATLALQDLPWVGACGAALAREAIELLLSLADWAAGREYGHFAVARPLPWLVALTYAALAPALAAHDPGRRSLARAALALLMAWIHVGPPPIDPAILRVDTIDVGQGQSVWVQRPGRRGWLIDAAGSYRPRFDPGERIVVPHLLSLGARGVQALVLSHEDLDHAGGASAVLRDLDVGELWLAQGWHRIPRLAELAAEARAHGVAVRQIGREADTDRLSVFGPSRQELELSANERSLALRFGREPNRILIPGDLGAVGEQRLLERGGLAAEALLLSHHGSRSGSTPRFLDAVEPRLAVASCGRRNRFGHPDREVIARLRRRGIALLRTDLHGCVSLRASSDGWQIRSCRRARARSSRSGRE